MDWRAVLRFQPDEDLDFATVHERYRELMTGQPLEAAHVLRLGQAIEAARRELGTSPRKRS